MVLVSLAAALICFTDRCYPVLVGANTPAGTFSLSHQATVEPGYGGDILVFQENHKYLWAIHRVYTLNPTEKRLERINSTRSEYRRSVTKGCINVMPDVYERLVTCCSKDILVIN
jgi:hypothetical protein